jgi:uncharacterized protein
MTRNRVIPVILLLIFCCAVISADNRRYDRKKDYQRVNIPMADGTLLSTDVFIPKSRKKVPAVLIRTPYNKSTEGWIGKTFGFFNIAVVIQDVRGKYGSEGEFYPFVNERYDGFTTLDWIREQPWSNGIVGGWGASYLGYTQWAISDSLDFLVPLLTGANLYDFVYPNGVFSLLSAFSWGVLNDSPRLNSIPAEKITSGMSILPLAMADDSTIHDVQFLTDWMVHETEDEYWNNMNHRGITRAPLLSIAGWYDIFLMAQINDFQALQHNGHPENRMIIGPWCHGNQAIENDYGGTRRTGNPRKAFLYTVRALKGKKKKLSSPFRDAKYNLFVMERNEYIGSDTWPPEETKMVNYYIGPGNYLQPESFKEDGVLSYIYDPSDPYPGLGGTALGDNVGAALQNSNAGRHDQLVFETDEMEKPLVLLGNISATLWLSSDSPCTGFVVSVQDVFPDGRIVNIQEGAANVQFNGVIPEKIEIPVWATGYQIDPGHRLRVVITSGWFPRFNRNLNGCEPIFSAESATVANQIVFYGGKTPSGISMPVFNFSAK